MKKVSKKLKLKISIIILIVLILVVISIFGYDKITANKKNNETSKIIYEFYQSLKAEEDLDLEIEGNKVIGIIVIDKIGIRYPIIEYKNIDSLNISICKYSGPDINQEGNLCLMGHNMRNGVFFSNLYKLENGDNIEIVNMFGKSVKYIMYDKYYIEPTEMKVLESSSEELKEVTLITCNNSSNKRLIIKLREVY